MMMDQTHALMPAAGGVFPVTRWSRVSRLRDDPSSPEGQRALAEICESYWFPLYAFARRKGQSREDAQDMTQNFFIRMLDGGFFSRAQAAEGKMRTYLLTAFTRHMADEWDRANARKRGGGVEKLSLDFDEGERRYLLEPAAAETHDLAFERAWAAQIIDSAGSKLEQECQQSGKGGLFARIAPLITGGGESISYENLAGPCGMSVEALRQVVRRLRLRFRELLREAVADTLDAPSDADIDNELVALRAAMAS